ncbi:MAG: ABC transporter permease [Chloroflexales bacterium]|nr:ABC transporter permease [Chloroflexales bacterium]
MRKPESTPGAPRATLSPRPSALSLLRRQPYLFALLLLAIAVAMTYALQPNFFRPAALSGNLRTYLPLMLLAAGQTVVVIAGGVDLSVGAIVSLANVVIVSALGGAEAGPGQVAAAVALGLGAGALAGALNGVCVAYLRFQPIITTFATSFIFNGAALWILPSPGGSAPPAIQSAYASRPLGIPLAVWVALALLLLWALVHQTRYARYLYAVGGNALAAYTTGVPVPLVRLSSYVVSGLLAAGAGLALVLSTGTADPLIGEPMTLSSIVAVVLGGTRLSGGQGGLLGTILGVYILGFIRTIISFAGVPSWWQTLVDGLIVMLVLAGPGLVALLRGRRAP